ncbi:TonB-dependent receptor [uncultured Hyphomonas sp.]|uniref:TonB-dependent receptor domain-containing protein n=1 Tax=uncultured Hyphomonas sp. TaxID=225298 RepID=UPI0030DCFFB3|tara:strand:+ start:31277 stop:33271 length:1995 start_codon:yes stop_codon:yes gene_type:complete
MHHTLNRKTALLGATAIVSAVLLQAPASAQETAESETGEFLGTLTLGESKRDVQTDTATPVTVVDQEEIEDRQAGTIAELIDSVPGVSLVNGSTPIGSGINIRGFGANGTYGTDQKVAIQVDGASVGSEELYRIGSQLFTDPYLYKSVEVIRGTVGSFEYGSGIIGGVVRLETIDASDLTDGETGLAFRQTLGGATNMDGFNSSSTLAIQPTENLELLANYSWREQHNQEDGGDNVIENSEFELPSYLLKARYTVGDHSLRASYTNSETSERDKPYDSFGTTGGSFGNVDRDTKSETVSLAYNFNPVSNDFVNLDAIYSYASQEIDQECVVGSGPFGCFATVDADHRYETTKFTVKNTAYIETGALVQNLRTGIDFIQKERLDASSAPGGEDNRIALFAVDQIDFLDGWTFAPAIRFETSEIEGTLDDGSTASYDNDALMGGASLRYQFESGIALFGSYAYTESLPILDDLENEIYMTQPEIGKTYEFGASYDRIGVFGQDDTLSMKANYYHTDQEDNTSYSGVDSIELQGLELEGSYARRDGYYVDVNANIVDAEQTRTDNSVTDWTNAPANTVRLTLGKRLSRLADLSSEFVAADEADRNGTATPGFVTANLRATITPQEGVLKGTSFRFGLENLFDHTYTPLLSTRPAAGRNIKFTVAKAF